MCGNDYAGHLHTFTIGRNKGATGRRGRAYHAMRKYCALSDPADKLRFVETLELDNRWSDGDAPPATNFTKVFFKALAIVYYYPVYRYVFSTR